MSTIFPMSKRMLPRVLLLGGALVVLILLLRPLSDRKWRISPDELLVRRKEEYLTSVRTVDPVVSGEAPHVILILADDLSLNDISVYGGPVDTPHIARIGDEGVVFSEATCTTSICAPSRAALLTGRYQQRFGFELQPHDRYAATPVEYLAFRYLIDTGHMVPVNNTSVPSRRDIRGQGLPVSEITLPELLQARGYRTAAYGKWHLGYTRDFSPLRFGFEEHYGFYEAFSLYAPIEDESIVDTPIDDFSDRHMWSRGRRKASAIVHNDEVVEEPEYLTFRFADLAVQYIESHSGEALGAAPEPFFLYLPFNAPHTPLQAPEEYVDRFKEEPDPVRRTYFAMIAALDDAVGEILDAIDRVGIAEDTLIVFASDNGGTSYLGVTDNGPLAGGKFTNFDGGLRVPLLMRYPDRISPGRTVDVPVSLMDIYATVEAATRRRDSTGAVSEPLRPGEAPLDGVDLLPHINGEINDAPHQSLFFRSIYNRAVRTDRWKLMVFAARNPTGEERSLLFDLDADPCERNDISSRYPAVVDGLESMFDEWEDSLIEPLWPPVMHFRLDVWGRRYWFAI